MPYRNEYNQNIADEVHRINQSYIEHSRLTGQGQPQPMEGGFLGALAGMVIPSVISSLIGNGMEEPNVASFQTGDARQAGEGYSGGALGSEAGFAKGTHMDTGFERTVGAGKSGGVKKYRKRKPKMLEGMGDCGCEGGAEDGPVSGAGMKSTNPSHIIGGGRKQRAELVKKIMKEKGLSMIEASKYVKQHNLYKGSGMSGGTELGLPDSIAGGGMSGGALVPVANMKASYMAGQGRSGAGKGGRSKRAEIVKKIMKEKGLSMIEASKYVKQHNLY
jgi:hypothetical protein